MRAGACVVGLGGTGLACVDELLRERVDVVGLDAGVVAGAAAGRNGGILRAGLSLFHHEARERLGPHRAARLYRATAAERDALAARLPGLVRRCGWSRIPRDPADERDARLHLEALQADGVAAAWLDGPLGPVLFLPGDAAVDPLKRCLREAADVAARGARLFEHSAVVRLRAGLVETDAGRVRCSRVIAAVDGALVRLFPSLSDRVRPTRLQMIGAELPPGHALPVSGSTRRGWDYWQRLDATRIAFGGCRDAGGDAEWTEDASVSPAVQQAIEAVFEALTGHPPAPIERWAATVGYTTDGLPVIEEVQPGVWAVGGYSGTGNLLGPVCGRAAVRLALGRTTESPLA